jgi:hypothetical protein
MSEGGAASGRVFPFVADATGASHRISTIRNQYANFYILFTQGGDASDAIACIRQNLYSPQGDDLAANIMTIPPNARSLCFDEGLVIITDNEMARTIASYYVQNIPSDALSSGTSGVVYYFMFNSFHAMVFCPRGRTNQFFRHDSSLMLQGENLLGHTVEGTITDEVLRMRNYTNFDDLGPLDPPFVVPFVINRNMDNTCWVYVVVMALYASYGEFLIRLDTKLEEIYATDGDRLREVVDAVDMAVGGGVGGRGDFVHTQEMLLYLTRWMKFLRYVAKCKTIAWIDLVELQENLIANPMIRFAPHERVRARSADAVEVLLNVTRAIRKYCNTLDTSYVPVRAFFNRDENKTGLESFKCKLVCSRKCIDFACRHIENNVNINLENGISVNPSIESIDVTTSDGMILALHSIEGISNSTMCSVCGGTTEICQMTYARAEIDACYILNITPGLPGRDTICLESSRADGYLQLGPNLVEVVQVIFGFTQIDARGASGAGHYTSKLRVRIGGDGQHAYYYFQDGVSPLLTTEEAFNENAVCVILRVVGHIEDFGDIFDTIRERQRQFVSQRDAARLSRNWDRMRDENYPRALGAVDDSSNDVRNNGNFLNADQLVNALVIERDIYAGALEDYMNNVQGAVDPFVMLVYGFMEDFMPLLTNLQERLERIRELIQD